jgi:hypothetical protein
MGNTHFDWLETEVDLLPVAKLAKYMFQTVTNVISKRESSAAK